MRALLEKVLHREGYEVVCAGDGQEALRLLEEVDLAIVDLRMPRMDGLSLLREARSRGVRVPVIVMTAFGSIDSAVEAMKAGAYHYLTKPFSLEEALVLVERALRERELERELEALRREVERRYGFHNLVGKSKAMQQVFELIRRVSHSRSTVLIQGSSGTGKELVARAIHYSSPRRDRPFVAVECSAIPETLLESELFGYVRGAFTGAVTSRKGLLEEADGGTLFLDEIGDLSPSMQVKLLRTLQEREVRRIGAQQSVKVDVRLIAATNRDLEEAVRRGEFRADLFYRLNVITINLPDLKDRPEDIPLLAHHFLRKFAEANGEHKRGISKEAMDLLMNYHWPGNVRELENVIERAVILGRGPEVLPEDLPPRLRQPSRPAAGEEVPLPQGLTLRELELRYIQEVLRRTGGRKAEAARLLGISRRTLYRRLRELGVNT